MIDDVNNAFFITMILSFIISGWIIISDTYKTFKYECVNIVDKIVLGGGSIIVLCILILLTITFYNVFY